MKFLEKHIQAQAIGKKCLIKPLSLKSIGFFYHTEFAYINSSDIFFGIQAIISLDEVKV